MSWELIPFSSEKDWLDARRSYVTSSDVPAILGISPYEGHNPYSLYLKKIGQEPEESGRMRRRFEVGRAMEPLIERWFQEETGRTPFRPAPGHYLVVNPMIGWAAATPDLLVIDGQHPDGVVESKSEQIQARTDYEESPHFLYARAQIALPMLVCEMQQGWIAVEFGHGLEFRVFPVAHDPALAELVRERCSLFHQYLVNREPPDESFITGAEGVKAAIARIFEAESGESMVLDAPGALESANRYDELQAGITKHAAMVKKLEVERDQVLAAFELRMGLCTFGRIPGYDRLLQFKMRKGGAENVDTRWERRVLTVVKDGKGKP